MADVVIIGGGAAGMAAAIEAAHCGDRVTLLERMDRVGKKLLATGNGRCNLMNTGFLRYPGGSDFAREVLAHCSAEQQQAFWRDLGLHLRTEEAGRVYPVSGQASSVLDALRLAMENAGVQIVTGANVREIRRDGRNYRVLTDDQQYRGQRVIVCGGGCAQSKLGSDGSCYTLLKALGHTLFKPEPALTQILTDTAPIKGLSGIRVKCTVRVMRGQQVLHEEAGEGLFADYGMSGVCVMQCARYAAQGTRLVLDMLEGMGFASQKEMAEELMRRQRSWASQSMEKLLTGLCVPRLASALCAAADIHWKNRSIASLTASEAKKLAAVTGGFELAVKGVKGFESAQVTRGGVDCSQFDPATMESRLSPGLHAAGEVLDVDGDCGGFNLMFAFGSGILAGRNGR